MFIKNHKINFFSLYVPIIVLISLTFIIYNLIWAQVEQTKGSLKDYLNITDCPKFVEINEITMKDACTNLVWARYELPTFKIVNDPNPGYTWQEANEACLNLAPAGMFRLPTVEELQTLLKRYKCGESECISKSSVISINGKDPVFSQGVYWSSSDFNEPTNWIAAPLGNDNRNYKRSVNLLTGRIDSPVFGQNTKLNVWCIVNQTPETFEKKFINSITVPITGASTIGHEVISGQLVTIYHRQCNATEDCMSISNSQCLAKSVEPIYSCLGTEPENAVLCPADDSNLPTNTAKTLVTNCTEEIKCEYICDLGYHLVDNSCIANSCTGSAPSNAVLCLNDDSELKEETQISLVESCTPETKCEYICIPGYILINNSCEPPSTPTVSITSPSSGSSFDVPEVTISVSASDRGGKIIDVEILKRLEGETETILHTFEITTPVNNFESSYTWSNIMPGKYTLIARATDNDGNVINSAEVTISFAYKFPLIKIINPVNGAYFRPNTPVTIKISADEEILLNDLKLYANSNILETWGYTSLKNFSQIEFVWRDVVQGQYQLKAVGTAFGNPYLTFTSNLVNIIVSP